MPQIRIAIQIRLEPQMVVGMHHFVGHDILEFLLGAHVVGTDADAVFVIEAALRLLRTRPAPDVVGAQVPAELLDVVLHEDDDRRGLEQFVPVLLAPCAVEPARPLVAVPPVLLRARRAHLARRHPVEVLGPVQPAVAREECAAVPAMLGGGGRDVAGGAGAPVRAGFRHGGGLG